MPLRVLRLVAKIGLDTDENELSSVSRRYRIEAPEVIQAAETTMTMDGMLGVLVPESRAMIFIFQYMQIIMFDMNHSRHFAKVMSSRKFAKVVKKVKKV